MRLLRVSIPQGPINTSSCRRDNFRRLRFQFRKVQLIQVVFIRLSVYPLFQFRKVQLIPSLVPHGAASYAVSIPQGPINTLSSIQQSPL